jgi:hypothetical protein
MIMTLDEIYCKCVRESWRWKTTKPIKQQVVDKKLCSRQHSGIVVLPEETPEPTQHEIDAAIESNLKRESDRLRGWL